MKTVDFDFDIGQRVHVLAVNVFGFVDSLSIAALGKHYRVIYWMNGQRCETWMYGEELKPA